VESALSLSSSAASTLLIEKKIAALKQLKALSSSYYLQHSSSHRHHHHHHTPHEETVQTVLHDNERRIEKKNTNQGIVDDLKGAALPDQLDEVIFLPYITSFDNIYYESPGNVEWSYNTLTSRVASNG